MRTIHSFVIFFLKFFLQRKKLGPTSLYINSELQQEEAKEKVLLILSELERLSNLGIIMSLSKMILLEEKLANHPSSWQILLTTIRFWLEQPTEIQITLEETLRNCSRKPLES